MGGSICYTQRPPLIKGCSSCNGLFKIKNRIFHNCHKKTSRLGGQRFLHEKNLPTKGQFSLCN